jgi:phenylalanyl-tRNA synthetase beta chain
VFGLELEIEPATRASVRYTPLPTTPPVERDLALVLPEGVRAQQVEEVVGGAAGALLEHLAVFDEYRAAGLAGRSVAWRLVFRARDRTLRDEEVDTLMTRILDQLRERLGVERRET